MNNNFVFYPEPGDECPVHYCNGTLDIGETHNCSCHLGHPPCSNCINTPLVCSECGWEGLEVEIEEEGEEEEDFFPAHYRENSPQNAKPKISKKLKCENYVINFI